MHPVLVAALELQAVLEETGHPFCFIGGLALQRWGEPRMTEDADATVISAFDFDEELIQLLFSRFKSRRSDGPAFARRNRVVVIEASNGVGLDVALGALEFEVRVTERAVYWKLASGQTLRICTAEDLIVYKAFAARDQDWADIQGILLRRGRELRLPQIFQELQPLAMLKEDETMIPRLQSLMRRRGLLE
jgi:hypothetical protein